MAKRVWFENSRGEERVIKNTAKTWAEAYDAIKDFVDRCNQRKAVSGGKPFEIYYVRTWKQEDGRTRIDVGSHTEFFIWEGDIENEIPVRNR